MGVSWHLRGSLALLSPGQCQGKTISHCGWILTRCKAEAPCSQRNKHKKNRDMTREGVSMVIQFLASHPTECKYCFDARWNSFPEERKEKYAAEASVFLSCWLHVFSSQGWAQPEETWHELLNFGLCDLLLRKNIFRTFVLEE